MGPASTSSTAPPPLGRQRTAMVFGATGFIGRWLVAELLSQDVTTTAVVRTDASAARLLRLLDQHDVSTRPEMVQADFERDVLDGAPVDRRLPPRSTTRLARTRSG